MRYKERVRGSRNPESGYALLLVFAMAAIVAVSLYMQVPRVAFEAQRDKEQLLQDRGQEYSRAIALYVRKFNRFPSSMEDLENTNNQRFLRRRFADPMTGKTDWRILHAGPGGVITDSILNTKKGDADTWSTQMITLGPMTGALPTGDSEGVNLAMRVRPSDQAGAAGNPNNGGGGGSDSGSSSGNSGNSGAGGYNGPVMVLADGRIVPANSTGTAPVTPAPGTNPATPGMPPAPGSFVGAGGGGPLVPNGAPLPTGVAIQQNTQNGQPAQNTPGLPSQYGPPSGAANLINQILTSPRPGGMNGLQGGAGTGSPGAPLAAGAAPTSSTAAPQGQVIGAGIAGVASKREQEGIKTYNDRTKYNEWEFVYDITKDPTKVGAAAAGANAAAAAASANGGQGSNGATSNGATSASPGASGSTMSSGTTSGH